MGCIAVLLFVASVLCFFAGAIGPGIGLLLLAVLCGLVSE
jgi:hypothetical protein